MQAAPSHVVVIVALLSAILAACDLGTQPNAGSNPPGGNTSPLDDNRTVIGPPTGNARSMVPAPPGFDATNRMPICFVRGHTDDLEVVSEHGRNHILNGEAKVPIGSLAERSVERVRRVEDIRVTPDVVLVFVHVSRGQTHGSFPTLLEGSGEAPSLLDTQGSRYLPVGFVYTDSSWARVRYEPGNLLTKMSDLPVTTRSRADQRLWLIYRVSFGRTIKHLTRENKALYELNPPVVLNVGQAR